MANHLTSRYQRQANPPSRPPLRRIVPPSRTSPAKVKKYVKVERIRGSRIGVL